MPERRGTGNIDDETEDVRVKSANFEQIPDMFLPALIGENIEMRVPINDIYSVIETLSAFRSFWRVFRFGIPISRAFHAYWQMRPKQQPTCRKMKAGFEFWPLSQLRLF